MDFRRRFLSKGGGRGECGSAERDGRDSSKSGLERLHFSSPVELSYRLAADMDW